MSTDTALARSHGPLLLLLPLLLALCCCSSSIVAGQSFGDLRLVRMELDPFRSEYYAGDATQPATYSRGLLQIFNSSQGGVANGWGTVCNDAFDDDDLGAQVVCNQLGWPARAAGLGRLWNVNTSRWINLAANVNSSSLRIWLDEVSCDGTESALLSCSHRPFGESDCQHLEDVAIECFKPVRDSSSSSTGGDGGGGGGSSTGPGGGCPGCTGGGQPGAGGSSSSSFDFQWPVFFVATTAGALVLAGLLLLCRARRGAGGGPGGKHVSNKIHHRNRSAAASVADRPDDEGTKTIMHFHVDPCLLASQKAGVGAGSMAVTIHLSPPDLSPRAAGAAEHAHAQAWTVDGASELEGVGAAAAAATPGQLALPSFQMNVTPSSTPRFQGVG